VASQPTESANEQKKEYGKIGERPFVAFDDAKSTTPFERWTKSGEREDGEHGTKNGAFYQHALQQPAYMMLCCIPLFACVLKLLYIRRRLFYIDHLIYALHYPHLLLRRIMLIVLATIGLNRSRRVQLQDG